MKTQIVCMAMMMAAARDTVAAAPAPSAAVPDARHLSNGWTIPSNHYADQPYIVKTDDGALVRRIAKTRAAAVAALPASVDRARLPMGW